MTTVLSLLRLRAAGRPAAAVALLRLLSRLRGGTLEMRLPDLSRASFGDGGPLRATVTVHDWRAFSRVLKSGDIGFAEGWMEGLWDSPDPTTLMRLLLANRDALDRALHGSAAGKWLHWLRHRWHRNSRRGSARNIHAHYDIGNAFYGEWLDETFSYSSALFAGEPGLSLAEAQRRKMRRALREAGVRPGSRLLEIGCGWGGLAELAAREFGAHVEGITLSREQLQAARQRVSAAGLQERCSLHLADYRDLAANARAPFDAVVSIEMFEAVGEAYWAGWFESLRSCLKPGGRACIQTITIRDSLYERYRRSTDFIQQYIFPGGQLPSAAAFRAAATRAGFTVQGELSFGADYAETLRRWREAFLARSERLASFGFDERFARTWHFYLAYCEAGFAAGDTGVVQFTLVRD